MQRESSFSKRGEPTNLFLESHFFFDTYDAVLRSILERVRKRASLITLPCSLYDIAQLASSPDLAQKYRNVDIFTTDGMPLVWWGRWKMGKPVERVYGPDLMRSVLIKFQGKKFSHVFYGSSKRTLKRLHKAIRSFAPKTNILEMISPPFRALTSYEERQYLEIIRRHNPNVLWIGLSSPKQVVLASKWKAYLPNTSIFCVGAAFDLLAGTKPMAPKWMQRMGLEWLFRLLTEPRRLWKRYLFDIPLFLLFSFLSGLRRKLSSWI
jgi:N-acetylglucosaminyldiphosphoundecaprenol N-acetyl-beta-D-mannosaminyltransferase